MLQQQQIFLIVPCDKNLSPVIIERHDYLKIAMSDHLTDTTTYKSLTRSETDCYSSEIKNPPLYQNIQQNADTKWNMTSFGKN